MRSQEGGSPAPAITIHFSQEMIDGLDAPLNLDDPTVATYFTMQSRFD